MYDAHDKEREAIGVSRIVRDEELEKAINSDRCSTTESGSDIPKSVCNRCGLFEMGAWGKRSTGSSGKASVLQLKSWIEQKQFLVDGKCVDKDKCRHYELAFQTGKRVGCSFQANCPGQYKMIAKCFYCSNALCQQGTLNFYLIPLITFSLLKLQ